MASCKGTAMARFSAGKAFPGDRTPEARTRLWYFGGLHSGGREHAPVARRDLRRCEAL